MNAYTTPAARTFHPFKEEDFMAYGGAEAFADGSAPLIAEEEVGTRSFSIILDRNGIEVNFIYEDPDSDVEAARLGCRATKEFLMAIANHLPNDITIESIQDLGFIRTI